MKTVAILLFLIVVIPTLPANTQPCLKYEPDVVKLEGRMYRQTWGPKQDVNPSETYWILHLAKPVCVTANTNDELNDTDANDITRVQLVFKSDDNSKDHGNKKLRSFVKKHIPVIVTGTLYRAHTGHHHTEVLITIKDIWRK
jgi:hypothetical protein